MLVIINRDPFARSSTVREVTDEQAECSWCGGTRRSGRLFRYGTELDSLNGRINWHRGEFCSKQCHDSYHAC